MAQLVLGPLLRYVGEREATVWVETDERCEVEVLGRRARTFQLRRHHYALVCIEDLEPGRSYEYEVLLDGNRRWPLPDHDGPPSRIRTIDPEAPLRIAFGSCRVSMPHEPPYTCSKDEDERGFEFDALYVLAREMTRGTREDWPDVLMLLGDQVYVDEGSPVTRAKIRWERDTTRPPYEEAGTFEEYTWLYQESWGDPLIRWLLSTVSCSMVWDDHDMHDDWNISRTWVEEMDRHDWWRVRAVDGLMSYWVYQHLGNLSPRELEENGVWRRIQGVDDATGVLQDFAARAHLTGEGTRWSYCRDLGRTRLIVMDSRAGRVLGEDRRSIFDDHEWEWISSHAQGGFDHLLLATSDPFLLAPGLHHAEAWNESVCDGAWGSHAAELGERLRRGLDFDHWGAFNFSFERLSELLEEVGSGRRGEPPGLDRAAVGRRPSRLSSRGRLPPRRGGAQCRLPSDLLPVSQSARCTRARRGEGLDDAPGRALCTVSGSQRRRPRAADQVADLRRPLLRQPGGELADQGATGGHQPRQDEARGAPREDARANVRAAAEPPLVQVG